MSENVFKPRPKLDADHFVIGGGIHEMPPPEEPQPVVVRKKPTVAASSPSSRIIQQGAGSQRACSADKIADRLLC